MSIVVLSTIFQDSFGERQDEFLWLAQEQERVCNKHPTCNATSEWEDFAQTTCCGTCTCKPDCAKYGVCCLSGYDNFTHAQESTENNRYSCVRIQYYSNSEIKYQTDAAYFMVSRCDLRYPDDANKTLCEQPGQDNALDSIIPVTDLTTKDVYRNKYCLYCNNIDVNAKIISWKLTISNDHEIDSTDVNFLDELKDEVKAQGGSIIFKPPIYVPAVLCDPFLPSYEISSCNLTGLWQAYNKSIDMACNSYIDPFNHTYKNYFCYLCNIDEQLSKEGWICKINNKTSGDINITPPFSAILDITVLDREQNRETLICKENQFPDDKMMVCRNVTCKKEHILSNGACLPDIAYGYPYNFTSISCFSTFLKLTPGPNTAPIVESARKYVSEIIESIYPIVHLPSELQGGYSTFPMADTDGVLQYLIIYMAIYFPIDVEAAVYKEFFDTLFNIGTNNVSVQMKDHDTVFNIQITHYNVTYDGTTKVFIPNESDNHTIWKIDPSKNDKQSEANVLENCFKNKIAMFNKLYICPFVTILLDEYDIVLKNDLLIFIVDGAFNQTKVYSKWEYEKQGDKVYMCLDDYEDIYRAMPMNVIKTHGASMTVIDPKNILSLVCVSLSIICLGVTIATYMYFPVLQTQPGINNTMFAIFLLLAQSFYQFGAGQTSIASWACSLIGILCHFLWLGMMFSMMVCCVHMFIMFKKGFIITQKYKTRQTVKNILFVTCASLFFVSINLIVSLVDSNGLSSGYGGAICYISSNLLQLLTFILPSCLALIVNVCIFVYVVHVIWKVGRSSALLNKERNYLGVYVRLSALTGLTWAFGFLQLFLNHEFLEYVFIIFNASQGVFIMTAFVLNRRVLSLFRKKREISSQVMLRSLEHYQSN